MKHIFLAFFILGGIQIASAQITLPPSGNNQKSVITQYIGPLVHVTITYNSPDVTASNGTDRTGKIWGQLVPYGLNNLGFGPGTPAPWRAGANENTIIEFSHDVLVNDKTLKAGTYGFHVIVEESGPWTLIFSTNASSWGSYFYQESEDALRVQAEPKENPFHEWLTYEFIDRQPDQATVALMWENISLPFTISVPNNDELVLEKVRAELRGQAGFMWQNWNTAATFCLQKNMNLEEALSWAERSISAPFIGAANFTTLSTKAQILDALDRSGEAQETMDQAIKDPSATIFQIHGYGRQLIAQGEGDKALEIFQYNMERFGDVWPVRVGLARGYSAIGNYKEALKHAKIALSRAPDPTNKSSLEQNIEKLKAGQDIN